MDKFDGLLYGNGLTINLFSQLKTHVDIEKQYLLNIDDFLKAFILNHLNPKEENRIFSILYPKKDANNLKNFELLRNIFKTYYDSHNANIEYWLGKDLFDQEKCGYDYAIVSSFFPALYNIWHEIVFEYFTYCGFGNLIHNFNNSISSQLRENSVIVTTNYDRYFEALDPQYLHGKIVENIKKFKDIILYQEGENLHYKFLWGWNGVGKLISLEKLSTKPKFSNYYNIEFLRNEQITIEHLLVYGLSFQKSGYIEELSAAYSKYENPTLGGIVDEHILLRLNGLQTQGQLQKITFAYYSDLDAQHYKYLSDYFKLKEVSYMKSSEIPFSI